MSSNIKVTRICQQCGKEFEAKKTTTRTCSGNCAQRLYKAKLKEQKIAVSNNETLQTKIKPLEDLKAKEFLTVRDAAVLLNSSLRTVYRLIEQGSIKAVNLSQRKTLIKRSDIDRLFTGPEENKQNSAPIQDKRHKNKSIPEKIIDIENSYTTSEILELFRITQEDLISLSIKNNIPHVKIGWDLYYPKPLIDNLLN